MVYSKHSYFVIYKKGLLVGLLYFTKRRLHCADASFARTIYAAGEAIHTRDGMDGQKDINAFLAGKFCEHFMYTPGQEGRNFKVQCKSACHQPSCCQRPKTPRLIWRSILRWVG